MAGTCRRALFGVAFQQPGLALNTPALEDDVLWALFLWGGCGESPMPRPCSLTKGALSHTLAYLWLVGKRGMGSPWSDRFPVINTPHFPGPTKF